MNVNCENDNITNKIFTAALALRSRGLVIGSREKEEREREREEKEKEEKEREEEKNLEIAFRIMKGLTKV